MAILSFFSKPGPLRLNRFPQGSFAVTREGALLASTLSSDLSRSTLDLIGRTVLNAFARAREINLPLAQLTTSLGGLQIVARELRGGALIFLQPESLALLASPQLAMKHSTLKEFILYLETYIECWKQFNHYVDLARTGKYTPEDEAQFLEIKSLITQGLEVILAAIDQGAPRKEDVMMLINAAPSLRFLAQHDHSIANVEGQWHKLFLVMQSLLGQLKVVQQKQAGQWGWSSLFGRKK